MRIDFKRLAVLPWLAGLCAAAAAQFHPVDLSPDIQRQWGTFQPFSDWTFPAGGRQTFNSVPFDITGVVQLLGMEHAGKGNVRAVRKSFPVNRAFTQLHLLHYTEFSSSYGQPVAMLWLHYDDGAEPYSFPLRFGVHCMDWYHNPLQTPSGRTTTCVWMAAPASSRSRQVTGIWHTAIPNPHPSRSVKSIEIHSMFAKSTYSLVGLTLEAGESQPALEEKPPPSRKFPQIAMPGTRWLQFKDEPTGQPVGNAKASIALRDGERLIPWGEHIADSNGRMSILLPPWWNYAMEIVAAAPNHAPGHFSLEDNFGKDTNDISELRLKRGKTISGTVRDSTGSAVSNAALRIISVEGDAKRGFSLFTWPQTRTDTTGRWSAPAGENLRGLELRVSHLSFLPGEYEVGEPRAAEPWIVTASQLFKGEANMKLSPGAALRGQVMDGSKRPITNATIYCFTEGDIIASRRAKTDTSGQFAIGPFESGNVTLIVSAPEHAPALIRRKVDAAVTNLDVELKPASPLRMKVQNDSGQPIRGAYVVLVDWQEFRWPEAMHQSNDDGLVTFPGAPTDDAKYLVAAADMSSEILTLRAGTETVATLNPLARR